MQGPSPDLLEALMAVPGVRAVGLGGSRAAGEARADSDLDVVLFYRDAEPLDVAALRAVAARLDPRPERVVVEPGAWGPWVDGGAWLRVEGQLVDLLYRSLDLLERWIAASERGERVWDYAQTPTHGYHSHMLLAELAVCRPLRDPLGELARLADRVCELPPALRAGLLQDFLWHSEFSLYHARGHAARGDVYNTVGCLVRAAACLVQALHAEAGRFFRGDKRALAGVAAEDAAEIEAALARPGATAADLEASVARLSAVFARARERVGDGYRPLADLSRTRAPG